MAEKDQDETGHENDLHAWCHNGKHKELEDYIKSTDHQELEAKLVSRRGVFGYTPLHEAVSNGHHNMLDMLMEHGADVNCRANGKYTPLHLAASRGDVNCVRVLLTKDADIHAVDEFGKTPVRTAELIGKQTVVKVLKSEELIRAVRSSDSSNLNDLLKTPQNQLEPDCISRALLAAVNSGSSSSVGKLILRGATNIEEALDESKRQHQHLVTATLLIIKAALANDVSLVKTLYGDKTSSKHKDLLGEDFEEIREATRHSVKTVVPIEIARRISAHAVREELLLKTDIQMDTGTVSWYGLQLLQLETSWLKKIEWVKVLRLARNEFSSIPTDIGNYLKNCTTLSLQWNKLKEIPSCLLQLPSIVDLNLSHNMIVELPDVLEWPFSLQHLSLAHNRLTRLHKSTVASSIERLDLSYNYFRSVPSCVCSFLTIMMLDLSGNSKITALPAQLGRLKKLYDLKLEGLEDLNDPPKHVRVTTGDCMRYLRSRLLGEREYYRMKLMLVGKQLMGKSTIVARLQGRQIGDESTVGVDVSEWKFSLRRREFIFNVWDFAGQEEYYATHQCFLSKRSLYLLVWNITERDKGIADLKPWLSNISLRAPGSTVVIVATFLDKVSEVDRKSGLVESLCAKVHTLTDQFTRLKIYRSMAVGLQGKHENVQQLKEIIYNAAAECKIGQQLVMGTKIPTSYHILDTKLASLRERVEAGKGEPIMHSGDFKEMVRSLNLVDLQDDEELGTVTHFLHEVGSLLHYDDRKNNLDDLYFIVPQWLCKLMSTVVTVEQKNPYLKHGILKTKSIPILFRDKYYPSKYIYQYLTLLHRFEIALPLDREHSRILVPSLLPEGRPVCVEVKPIDCQQCYKRYVVFHQPVPPGLWGRLLSRIMNFIPEVRDYLEDLEPIIDDTIVTTQLKTSKSFPVIEVPPQRLFSVTGSAIQTLPRVYQNLPDSSAKVANVAAMNVGNADVTLVYWRTGLFYTSATLQFRVESLVNVPRKNQKNQDGVLVESSTDVRGRNIFGQLVDMVESLIYEWFPGLVKNFELRAPCSICLRDHLDTVQEFQVSKLLLRVLENKLEVVCRDNQATKLHDVQLVELVPELLFKDLDERFLLNPEEVIFAQSKQSLLGEGGFGRIYRGTYRAQAVAVKLYFEQSNQKQGAWIKDLISESKILQRLHHPCLICMVGVCVDPWALVLEEAPLGSLSSCLYNHHVVIPRIVIHRMAIQVVSALRFLHSIRIIFRDLKAANVLVWSLDLDHLVNCKVTDFNISAYSDPVGVRGFSGTKGFVAPEVAHVNKAKERSIYNHSADVFSYAMLLYQMIARRRPFHHLISHSIEPAIEEGQRPGLDDCPAAQSSFFYLTHVMKKCWQGKPEDRPSTDEIVGWLSSATLQLTLNVVPFKGEDSIRQAFVAAPMVENKSKPSSHCCGDVWIFFEGVHGAVLKVLSGVSMTQVASHRLPNNQILCTQWHQQYVWVATRVGLECSTVHIFSRTANQMVHNFALKDICINCMLFYNNLVCFGTMDGNCMLFPTDIDVKTIKSESFIKCERASNWSVSGIVLTGDVLWVSTRHQIILLDCNSLEKLGKVQPPPEIADLPVGKLALLEGEGKICSAFTGGRIVSLWDVKTRLHSSYVNVQQLLKDRHDVEDASDGVITAMNVALDTIWVGMGSGHILVFSLSLELLTGLKPYQSFVRFLAPLCDSGLNRYAMISGGKKHRLDESLNGLPVSLYKDETDEGSVDRTGVIVLWEVLPAKYLRHTEYLSSGTAWLNYSTLDEAVENTGLASQVKVDPSAINVVEGNEAEATVVTDDLKTVCSLADFQFGGSVKSTYSDGSLLEGSLDLSEETHTNSTSHSLPTDNESENCKESEHCKEAISFKLSDESNIILSLQKPVTIKSLIIDLINGITHISVTNVILFYPSGADGGTLIPIKSQTQLDTYLALTNRPDLIVHIID